MSESKDVMFMHFVLGLAHNGMVQLGKVINPITNQVERDLQSAKATIDLLMLLRDKTKGNLAKEEQDVLAQALSTLQLNYVEESNTTEKK